MKKVVCENCGAKMSSRLAPYCDKCLEIHQLNEMLKIKPPAK